MQCPEYAEHLVKSVIKCQMVATAPYLRTKDTSDDRGFCMLGLGGGNPTRQPNRDLEHFSYEYARKVH